jgi:hypothetical protein
MNIPISVRSIRSKTNSERRWVTVFALIVMTFTSIPYILGYVAQGEEWRFTGFMFGVEDGNSYIGKMLRGTQGDWLFKTPYTAKDQGGAFIFLPYILLGKLASNKNQHFQLVIIYHVFRFTGGVFSIYAIYDFISLYIRHLHLRKFGVVLVTLGGGLGWFLVMVGRTEWVGSLPIDFYSPETFGFLGIYGIAHLPWARAFFFWGLRGYLLQAQNLIDKDKKFLNKHVVQTGIIWLITGLFNPITGVVIGVVANIHVIGLIVLQISYLLQRKSPNWDIVRRYAVSAISIGLIALPLVLYYSIVFLTDPFLKSFSAQNQLPAPHFLHYLVAYGLLIPFVILGIKAIINDRSEFGYLLVAWVMLLPIVLLIPLSLQRRLIEGLWVALVILSLVAYEKIQDRKFKRLYWVLLLVFPSTVFLIFGGVVTAINHHVPVFRRVDEVMAFEFLAAESDSHDVVLCSYETGNALPAWAPVFVIIGHGPESAGIKENAPRVAAFYQKQTAENDRLILLNEFAVDFVFWGPTERIYGNWEPGNADFLTLIFLQGDYQVYKVIPSD